MSDNLRELAFNFVQQPTDDELEKSYSDDDFLATLKERSERQMEAALNGVEVAQRLKDCVQYMNPEPAMAKAFVASLTQHTHRHTQNEIFFTLIFPLIKEWANAAETRNFDGRNQYIVQMCQDWIKARKF